MREHDLELIAALVEGRLDDESEARALIASSEEAMEEYEAQKLAYESLREMGSARLTDVERASLHRDLWTQVNAAKAPPARTKPGRFYRWVSVAAVGLFVLVGLAAVLSRGAESGGVFEAISGGGGDSAAETTTTAADAAAVAEQGDGDDAVGGEAQTDTTEAASEGTMAPLNTDDAATYIVDAARIRQGDFSDYAYVRAQESDAEDHDLEECVDLALIDAGFIDFEIIALMVPDSEDTTDSTSGIERPVAVALPEGEDPEKATLVFVDLDTCEVVYIDQ